MTAQLVNTYRQQSREKTAHQVLAAKALSEFAHEGLISPSKQDGEWLVTPSASQRTYWFRATVAPLRHWVVEPDSIYVVARADGERHEVDVVELVADLRDELGLDGDGLVTYLQEMSSTFAAKVATLARDSPSAASLATASLTEVEAAMCEGHPTFVATNGRIGFSSDDYQAFAPEMNPDVHLVWLAAKKSATNVSVADDMNDYWDAVGAERRLRFDATLREQGLIPDEYYLIPVHPWQWQHYVAIAFAPDIACQSLVYLGSDEIAYQPQQSIRTLLERRRPAAPYVKVALSIQNMGFIRGLSPEYLSVAPAICRWVASIVRADPVLIECSFDVLEEYASVGYIGDVYHQLPAASSHTKMIAALWRQNPASWCDPDEHCATMAALLHRDQSGESYVSALIDRSGLPASQWLSAYLRAYLIPLVHCLSRYGMAFMPHGENIIMKIRDGVIVGVYLKDLGEEVAVMDPQAKLPADVERIRVQADVDVMALSIFTDVFDGFFRYLSTILNDDGLMTYDEFWRQVAAQLNEYTSQHPQWGRRLDMFVAEFAHSCLNRLQLRSCSQMVDLSDPTGSLIFHGTMPNPISGLDQGQP